uniref:UNC93-like protein MFSD11 n=1 Tax=Syphacia muris TaxID=451379 RepID=A0A0N5AMX3_9BILA
MNLLKKLKTPEAFELLCILQLGFGTTFMWTGFDTHGFILESVLHSVHERDPDRIDQYGGYLGQAVNYGCFTVANFFTPLLVRYLDPKWSVFIGSISFTLYQIGFMYINSYYFYASAALLGIGFAVFYAGHGCYLTEHSTKKNMPRNSSLAWGIACMSMSVGGFILLVTFLTTKDTEIDGQYRRYSDTEIRAIFGAFAAFSFLSNIVLLLLSKKKPKNSVSTEIGWQADKRTFLYTLTLTFRSLRYPNVWLLASSWAYIGIFTGFMLGAYPTTLIFTARLSKSNILVPLYALSVGFGEVSTGILVTYLSKKFKDFGKIPSATIGFTVNIIAYVLIFISTPRYSSLRQNDEDPLLIMPNYGIPIFCGYLLGMGDCWWNTARSCSIPILLPECRAEGFAVSKVFQSLASCGIYFLSTVIDLYGHFGILIGSALLSLGTFIYAIKRDNYARKRKIMFRNAKVSPSEIVSTIKL